MGRKTYLSLPRRPLPDRENVVISTSLNVVGASGVKVFNSLEAGLSYCGAYSKVFICGGASLYVSALNFADKIELTLVHKPYEGDTYFPEINRALWAQASRVNHEGFSFITLTRVG
jgi:dihydrofolate reductase